MAKTIASDLRVIPLTAELLPRLIDAAAADRHRVVAATHVAVKDNVPVGYFSAVLPTLIFWSSTRNTSRETFSLLQQAEQQCGSAWVGFCTKTSPLYPLMGRLGYQHLGETDIFIKQRA